VLRAFRLCASRAWSKVTVDACVGGTVEGLSRSTYRATDRDTLAELRREWHSAGLWMPAGTWTASSGLDDWTVRELYAHVARGVSVLAEMVTQAPAGGEPDLPDAAAYFAAVRPLGAAEVAKTAKAWAADRSDSTLVEAFRAPVPMLSENTVVHSIAGTIRVADFAVTRILEATVHLLDLHAVAPHAGTPAPDALRRTVDVLADLTSPADFVLAATGRSSSAVFPVLT
jgi:hypothetical protein